MVKPSNRKPVIAVLDGVGQPTDAPRDGQRAVSLRAHLRQATRLVLRRHDDHVRAGHQAVLLRAREVRLHADAPRRAQRQLRQDLDVFLLALPQEQELRVERQEARAARG